MKDFSPKNEGKFIHLKAGDRIFVGNPRYEKRTLKTVTRVTATLVICGEGGEYDRYYRARFGRSARRWSGDYILSVATDEQASTWEAEEEKKLKTIASHKDESGRIEAERIRLSHLFPRDMFVRGHKENDWSLEIEHLTTAQVEKISILLGNQDLREC